MAWGARKGQDLTLLGSVFIQSGVFSKENLGIAACGDWNESLGRS